MNEKRKRHIEEDALLNQVTPTKRIRLIPNEGPKRARHTKHEPVRKMKDAQRTGQQEQKTTALMQLFPELQQKEDNYT